MAQERRGVLGALVEAEGLLRSRAAAVPARVEPDHPPAVDLQQPERAEPVRVGRDHPAVQQQDRAAVTGVIERRPGVAPEQLAAVLDLLHVALGERRVRVVEQRPAALEEGQHHARLAADRTQGLSVAAKRP